MTEITLASTSSKCTHPTTAMQKIFSEIGATASSIAKKQSILSETKIDFENHVGCAKKDAHQATSKIIDFAEKAKESLIQRIDDMSSRRRLELENVSAILNDVPPQLFHLSSSAYNEANKESPVSEKAARDLVNDSLNKLAELNLLVYSTFSGEQWEKESLSSIDLNWTDTISSMLDGTQNLHSQIRVLNYLRPEDLTLKLRKFVPEQKKLDICIESQTKNISKHLLTEMCLQMYAVKYTAGKFDHEILQNSLFEMTTIKELNRNGMVNFEDEQKIIISCPIDLSILNEKMLLVDISISEVPIEGSPLYIHVSNDDRHKNINYQLNTADNETNSKLWVSVGPNKDGGNITRTGKQTHDLDESDLKAMGYLENTKGNKKSADFSKRLSTVRECLNEHPSTESMNSTTSFSKLGKEKISMYNHLPLNHPSPLGLGSFKRPLTLNSQSVIALASPTQKNFIPSVKSTANNLEAKLEEYKKACIVNDDNDNGIDGSFDVLAMDPNLEISKLQERLSGVFQPMNKNVDTLSNDVDPKMNQADTKLISEKISKNVSFNPETTILKEIDNDEKEITSNLKHAETLPYEPASIDNATLHPGEVDTLNQWQIKTVQTKINDGNQSLAKSQIQLQNASTTVIGQIVNSADATFVSNGSFNPSEYTSIMTDPSLSSLHEAFKTADEWKMSTDQFIKSQEQAAKQSKLDKIRALGGVQVMWDDESKDDQWMDSTSIKKPEFDLTSPRFQFQHVKTLRLFEEAANVIPQSVAKDSNMNRTYISDTQNNSIYMYNDWEYKGIWAPEQHFIYPRYILCVPDFKHDNRNGMNVVVLDQVALYYFRSDGTLKSKLFNGEGCHYRGLAYHEGHGHIVTTEKIEGEGVYLVFLDLNINKDIVKKILLEPTTLSQHHIVNTKCRFIACKDNRVITTDMGLNCYYITNLQDNKTEVHPSQKGIYLRHNIQNILREPTGVFIDPAGNVVVAASPLVENAESLVTEDLEILNTSMPISKTKHANQKFDFSRGKLQLFSPNGTFICSLANIDIERPAGVIFDGKNLYVADVGAKVVENFIVAESSPRKRKGSISSPVTIRKDF